ncbi:glycosyltransferase [Exiguobacterium acetylicum]|uniref:glycosyltransferase n=1 Tax=Exiguobacterium sp. BMC-KP TaxID=1684312 RepID=UPI0006AA588D|nr:glycosyltransferase family 2 protein [Exiguobacterium sp. BMC-KP]KOP28494.1 glycosyl transferase [Exiguobacterium sp. BMC-KP]
MSWFFLFFALAVCLYTWINLAFLPRLVDQVQPDSLAICIPLRNEERNVQKLLDSLAPALTQGMHVYLYEDRSTDRTRELLIERIGQDDRFTIIDGLPLPEGWAGKVHACHQLAQRTTEDHLLFLDADVTLQSDAICRLYGTLRAEQAVFLSGFPSFPVPTFLGKCLIPMQHVLIAQHLPIPFRKVKHPAFAAANGMVVLVERRAYEQVGGHKSIQAALVDDLELCRTFKRHGLTTTLVEVAPAVSCDMYATNEEVWQGFLKNVFRGMNDSYSVGLYFLFFYLIQASVLPLFIIQPSWQMGGALILLYLARFRIDAAARIRHVWWLHPLATLLYVVLLASAMVRSFRKREITWKGRTYS